MGNNAEVHAADPDGIATVRITPEGDESP